MEEKRRIAILLELPNDSPNLGMNALRRFLKGILRCYGLKCLSIKEPVETMTFGNDASKEVPE